MSTLCINFGACPGQMAFTRLYRSRFFLFFRVLPFRCWQTHFSWFSGCVHTVAMSVIRPTLVMSRIKFEPATCAVGGEHDPHVVRVLGDLVGRG